MHRTLMDGIKLDSRKPLPILMSALVLVALLVAACAPRAGGGETLQLPNSTQLSIDLPAIVVDFDENGQPHLGDVAIVDLVNELSPGLVEGLAVPANAIQVLTERNVQHIQISNSPSGILLLVNGKAMPSLRWNGEELANTAQVIDLLGTEFGPGTAVLEELLPIVAQFGVGVVARFPVAEGIAAIPLDSSSVNGPRMAALKTQESFLRTVSRPPTISVPIIYDAQGSWRVGDLTYAEWISLTGMPIFDSFRLRPEAVDSLISQGITEFAVSTDVDGIHVSINGRSLPFIGWADGELNNALALADQVGVWETLEAQNMDVDEIVAMVEMILPVVQATEITITAHFPEAIASVN